MSELRFVVGDRVMSEYEFKQRAQKRVARKSESLKAVYQRDEAKESLGFVVVGYSPDHWAQRIEDHKHALRMYEAEPTKSKDPGSLDEFTTRWLLKNKPKRARSKPYEIESSAEQCAEMLRKAGWLNVRVDELLRG